MTELKKNCIFCKIIRDEIPSYTIFENEDIKAFLDISQVTKGHTLIIPKKHITNFFDYTKEDSEIYLKYIPMIAQAIKKSDLEIKGLNVEVNNGEIAGQVVMHSHIHLIPRYSNQDPISTPHVNNADQYSENDYLSVVDSIRLGL